MSGGSFPPDEAILHPDRANEAAAAITLDNLTVTYDRRAAVHHISGSFAVGSSTAIVGPNGAGKSTLLKAIVGEKAAASGQVRRTAAGRVTLAYLPQVAEIDRAFPLTVADTVLLGAWRQCGPFRKVSAPSLAAAADALALVGLEGFGGRPIGSLSFGQFRRVLFARLLLQDADIILLDEPFAAVDQRTQADLLALIERWKGECRTIVAVLHDLDQVRAHFPQSLLIARELIAWGATDDALSPGNLRRARDMSEAWDDGARVCDTDHRRFA